MKKQVRFEMAKEAQFTRNLTGQRIQYQSAEKPSRFREILCYGLVFVGVAAATFVVTPAFSQGAMAPEVRVITVRPSPSIISLGSEVTSARSRERAASEVRRHNNRMELEAYKADNRRQLEADRAYYKRLEAQRKGQKN